MIHLITNQGEKIYRLDLIKQQIVANDKTTTLVVTALIGVVILVLIIKIMLRTNEKTEDI